MEFDWDEAKRLSNLRKHGIDFIDVPAVFEGDIVTVEDDRFSYGEQRFVTFGLLQGRGYQTQINTLLRAYMEAHQ